MYLSDWGGMSQRSFDTDTWAMNTTLNACIEPYIKSTELGAWARQAEAFWGRSDWIVRWGINSKFIEQALVL